MEIFMELIKNAKIVVHSPKNPKKKKQKVEKLT